MKSIAFRNVEELKYGRREAINSLKTNMQFAGVNVKTVILTSGGQSEGKSTVTFDLAVSLAEDGNKVVLVDADMRKSQLISRYKIDNGGQKVEGLTNYLSGNTKTDDIICATNIQGLHIVMSGPLSTKPTELLNGSRFEELIRSLENDFDFVIIDSPPLGAVIDAAIMAKATDGAIIVLEANKTEAKVAKMITRQLEIAGAKILGYVLNKVDVKDSGYYGKYKYYGE